MKWLVVFSSLLDGMLVHHGSLLCNLLGFLNNSSVPMYTPGWREALWELSVLPKNTTQCSWPMIEPGPLSPGRTHCTFPRCTCSIVLKIRPLSRIMLMQLQMFLLCVSYLEKLFKSFFIYFNSCNCLLNLTQDHVEMLIKGLKMHINIFFKKDANDSTKLIN